MNANAFYRMKAGAPKKRLLRIDLADVLAQQCRAVNLPIPEASRIDALVSLAV